MAEAERSIVDVRLDERSIIRRKPEVEHERATALFDLLEQNHFVLCEGPEGPYHLVIGLVDNRLVLSLSHPDSTPITDIVLPTTPFRAIIKDYFLICESYYEAIRSAPPSKIEAIDMGRRGLHNEGAALLRERLADKVVMDEDTARRLFTLICVLHLRG